MEFELTPEIEERIAESLPEWVIRRPELRRRLQHALAGTPANRMTFEEFLDWVEEDIRAEWVDGEVIIMSPVSLRHQQLSDWLTAILLAFVETEGLGTVLSAPIQMRLQESSREPDLVFVAEKNAHRLKKTYVDGPADLVIEIVSPESVGRDRGEKYQEYEAAGIPEYWLIDPAREQAEMYLLDQKGRYQLQRVDEEHHYHARQLPGFWLDPTWLWQDPLPKILDVLRELAVI